ncbi:MAG TPA: sugar transferase [Solirubrobacterales bacterium]|jgi:exopolysaccharide biosynthesis polyprenyl glycosylphosphotransferase|nr:sugar transferase [Solirubrobacterales bacterium]
MDSIAYDYESHPASLRQLGPSRVRRSRAIERSVVLRRLLLAADAGSALLAGLLTALVFSVSPGKALGFTAVLLVGSVVLAFVFGLYGEGDLWTWASGLGEAPRALVAALLLSWPAFAAAALLEIQGPALIALVGTTATAGFDGISRALARGVAHRKAPLRQRTVIVGSGLVADRLADRLDRHAEFGLEAIGLVDDDVLTLGGTQRLPKLGSLSQLDRVLDEAEVDRVIIAFSRASHQQLLSCIRTCRDHRVDVDVVPRLFELLDGANSLNQIGGLPLLSIGAPPLNRTSRVAKRGLDLVVSSLALLVLSPLLAAIAIGIKFDSRGSVLFRQVRAGRGGKEFKLVKFRSMYRDAEERKRLYEEQNEADDGVMFKIKEDPRITRFGRFLRRTSLDELPQLLNVLRGEMSLVGPRPLILEESKHAAQTWHARRLDLRPGITGLWQVSGRSDLPFQEMVRFDYQYVAGWSLARDIEILLATIPVVLSGRGAY